MSASQIDT